LLLGQQGRAGARRARCTVSGEWGGLDALAVKALAKAIREERSSVCWARVRAPGRSTKRQRPPPQTSRVPRAEPFMHPKFIQHHFQWPQAAPPYLSPPPKKCKPPAVLRSLPPAALRGGCTAPQMPWSSAGPPAARTPGPCGSMSLASLCQDHKPAWQVADPRVQKKATRSKPAATRPRPEAGAGAGGCRRRLRAEGMCV
jgi:hypothetical protein